jgi:hypothetical protein
MLPWPRFFEARRGELPGGSRRLILWMELWNLRVFIRLAVAIALAYVLWIFASRSLSERRWIAAHRPTEAARNPEFEKTYGGTDLKILQFYARDGAVTEDGKTVICYGVLNAKAVRIDPPVEGIGVSLNRCLEVAPEHDTRYTLTAEGHDGRVVTASFDLAVVPDPATLPKITYFRIAGRKKDYLGRPLFVLAYANQNAEEVSIDPPVFEPLHRAPLGRFYVRPDKTTTYTLTVKGRHGHRAQKQLTVDVPEKR